MQFISTVLYILGFAISLTVHHNSNNDPKGYLKAIKIELTKEWPENRTINLVFHGHSVPAGYFNTPVVNTLDAYPYQVLQRLKEKYPTAVINIINTSVGGEHSVSGAARFSDQVLNHKPDLIFIDYALNDRSIGLESAKVAWEAMISAALDEGIKMILFTPSPDLRVDINAPESELERHAAQIRNLSYQYKIGLVDSYQLFRQATSHSDSDSLSSYMSQSNHPNAAGHALITNGIMDYF